MQCMRHWIHSFFDNVMTQFMINNRTDAWKTDVNLLNLTLDPPTEIMWLGTWVVLNTFINVDLSNVSMEGVCLFVHWWVYESCKVSRNCSQKTGHSWLNKVEKGHCMPLTYVLIACSLLSKILWTSIWYKKTTRGKKLLCPILIPLLIKGPLPCITAVLSVIVIVTAEDSKHDKMYIQHLDLTFALCMSLHLSDFTDHSMLDII